MGSGCGSVGRAVASNTRGQLFISSLQQIFIMKIFSVNCCKDDNKQKEAKMGHFIKHQQIINISTEVLTLLVVESSKSL